MLTFHTYTQFLSAPFVRIREQYECPSASDASWRALTAARELLAARNLKNAHFQVTVYSEAFEVVAELESLS